MVRVQVLSPSDMLRLSEQERSNAMRLLEEARRIKHSTPTIAAECVANANRKLQLASDWRQFALAMVRNMEGCAM